MLKHWDGGEVGRAVALRAAFRISFFFLFFPATYVGRESVDEHTRITALGY